MGLCYVLLANNDSQNIKLFIDKQEDDELSLILTGTYEGKPIQIDFENLNSYEAEELRDYLTLKIEKRMLV